MENVVRNPLFLFIYIYYFFFFFWILDVEIHFFYNESVEILLKMATKHLSRIAFCSPSSPWKEKEKKKYLTVNDPLLLWNNLRKKKPIILSKARYEWMHLKLQNIKSIIEYISVLFKINSQLKLCEENVTKEDMLKKENL